MSPKGVEHYRDVVVSVHALLVHPSMSPKGVEHFIIDETLVEPAGASINVAERR